MTASSTPAVPGNQQLFTELVGILAATCGEVGQWAGEITPDSRLEADLRMESIEFAVLGEALRARYGDRIRFEEFLADLEIEQLIGLTVADVMSYVAARRMSDSATGQASR